MFTFPTTAPVTATLTTAGARVRVIATERPDAVVLVEPADSTDKSDVRVAEHTEVGFAAGELSIKTTKSGGSVAITVGLPTGSKLVLNTASSSVHAVGPLGDCSLDVASGQVELDHVAALRGRLAAGAVTIGHVAGAAVIDGGTAGVRIGEAEGAIRYEGSTGDVWIGHARSDVELRGSSGSFTIDHAEGGVTATAAHCPIRIGRLVRGQAELVNAAGGIEVGIAAGTAAEVDAESTKGTVRNSLPTPDDRGASDTTVKVHARTRRDDIVIRPAS